MAQAFRWQGPRWPTSSARHETALQRAEAYLCGPPGMIDAAIVALRAMGMFSTRIWYDKFVTSR